MVNIEDQTTPFLIRESIFHGLPSVSVKNAKFGYFSASKILVQSLHLMLGYSRDQPLICTDLGTEGRMGVCVT